MRTRLALTTGFAALALVALAACTAPGASDGSDASDGADGAAGSDGSSGASSGLAGCLEGTWAADTADMAAQLQESFDTGGTPITSSTAVGDITLDVTGEEMSYDSNVTFTMIADADGLEMQVVQDQIGVSTGRWELDGDEVVFTDWETGIVVTNTITIAGQSAGDSTEIPASDGAGVPMTVVCEGDSLSTKPDESPFTTHWARIG